MKAIATLLLLLFTANGFAAQPVPTDAQAQQAHAKGACGSLGPGTGLSVDGRGWIVSMIPGRHQFRMTDGGTVGVTVTGATQLDLDAGRPYYIVVKGDPSKLEWKVPGSNWGPVSKLFEYPVAANPYKKS